MLLQHLPPDARPREKLLASGPASLADAELLALLLRTGFKGTSVLQLAQNLLDGFGGLSGLLHAEPSDLKRVKGLGPAKRAEVAAVVELARRSLLREIEARPVFASAQAVKTFLQLQMAHLDHEVFCVLFLDPQMRLIRFEQMFRGTLAKTSVHAREVVRRALDLHAAGVVLAHNHPTGVAEPSPADGWLTDQLKSALALIDVKVLDHLIVGRVGVMSFAERGML